MTEQQLDQIRQMARNGDGAAECQLAILYESDYFRLRVKYTLHAFFKGLLKIYQRALGCCAQIVGDVIYDSIEAFKINPSVGSFHDLLLKTIQVITDKNPVNTGVFSVTLIDGIKSLAQAAGQILDNHYPEWKGKSRILAQISTLKSDPQIDNVYGLLNAISSSAIEPADNSTVCKLLADALLKGVSEALPILTSRYGYKTAGVVLESNSLIPIYSADNNLGHKSIATGIKCKPIRVTNGKQLHMQKMLDLFTDDFDTHHNYIVINRDDDSSEKQKCAMSVTRTILSSVLAWIGPGKFTLDIIDWEHSGIASSVVDHFSSMTVRILTRIDEWETELNSLENLIEKRSAMMSSIVEYNNRHPERIEKWKVVVVQDFEGHCNFVHPLLLESKDHKKREEAERRLNNCNRFEHILKLGYKFGIVFIIGTVSGYCDARFRIDCGNIDVISDSDTIFRVKGLDHSAQDWLMNWLSAGEEKENKKNSELTPETLDGSTGVLTTILTDDGTDVEFRLDTVSHTHTFVIGKTGSGKSVLLHNILTGLLSKYSPEDLQLYIMDMKMGGVEFNRYRNIPHLRSLLVDNSDIKIVLEIMRDIDGMMRTRGREFRNAGVNSIKEYNKRCPDTKMSQVIIVIDECHVIFSMGSQRGTTADQREITERLSKIAKEGRSQGIHLIFATQTLSGADIPPDIQKNITDCILLKCAASDSETLVRGSCNKTADLPVGKAYYFNADGETLFQGIYRQESEIEECLEKVCQLYKDRHHNGQFYFNGTQIFTLTDEILENLVTNCKNGIAGSPGCMINLQQTPIDITLKSDYSENIILSGINTEEQCSRTTLALLMSQLISARVQDKNIKINVINCLIPTCETSQELCRLADSGQINLVNSSESKDLLKSLCDEVSEGNSNPTLLYIFGQERFSELKRNLKFDSDQSQSDNLGDSINDLFGGITFGSNNKYDSHLSAIHYLLENGPVHSHHLIIQVDKPSKLLFDENLCSAKEVTKRFKHIIGLRMDARSAISLNLDPDLNMEFLSADPDRLRAYYYCDDDNESKLFSPFQLK